MISKTKLIEWGTDLKESAIVFGALTLMMLPIRLYVFQYVTQNWIVSFVLIGVISLTVLVLSNRKKLGWFGRMFERQMFKLQKGKRSKVVYTQMFLLLAVEVIVIAGIELGNTAFVETKAEVVQAMPELTDREAILEQSEHMTPWDYVVGVFAIIVGLFVAFPVIAISLAIMNDTFNGWILHVYTVGFAESLQVLAMMIYFRTRLKGAEKVG